MPQSPQSPIPNPQSAHFVEPRPPVVHALVESGCEDALGGHDLEPLEARDARQQIEIGREQPFAFGDPVGDRHDDVPHRVARRLGDQPLAQRVLVAAGRLGDQPLVFAKRAGEELRLHAHPPRGAIELVAAERTVDQLFEPLHLLRLAPQLIVEAQHLGHEAGAQLKRQFGRPRRSPARRRLRHDVALERGEAARRAVEARVQPVVQLVARHGVDRRHTAHQLTRTGARRYDDERAGAAFGVRRSAFSF
jgi:hypothetical protein